MALKRGAGAAIALGLGVAALGAFILWETGEIRVAPIYSKVGPRDIPILIGAILAALGLALAWTCWRAKPGPPAGSPAALDAPGSLLDPPGTGGGSTDWPPLAAIVAGLVQQIVLLESLGFVPTAAILFFCVAYGFGSRRRVRDAAIAVALALVAYVGFVHALGLHLPAGILEGIL